MHDKTKICAIIQVRMSSSRLPGKALCDIDGLTVIERVINSLKLSKKIDEVIIATSIDREDDPIETLARNNKISLFRGDLDNVAKRFLDASEKFGADVIVRVTGDCPLVSYEIVDLLVDSHFKTEADFTSLETEKVPVGVCSEIISPKALKKLVQFNLNLNYSEYMGLYLKNNPDYFSINIVPAPLWFQCPQYRLTLDYAEDLDMFNQLYIKLKEMNMAISLTNILLVLEKHPGIAKLNSHLTLKYQTDKQLIDRLNKVTRIK